METPLWIYIMIVAIAILAHGLFVSAELALVSSRVSRLVELRKKGVAGATAALALKDTPEAFLAAIQIAITLVAALASVVGGAAALDKLTPWLEHTPLPGASMWTEPVLLVAVIVVITYFSLVVGELIPKALALRDPERLICALAPFIARLSRILAGSARVLAVSTNVVLRLVGRGKSTDSPFVSEEEVKSLVREGAAQGVFEKVEEELVHNVFEFTDTTVREIMVPRMRIVGLEIDAPSEQVLKTAAAIGHSRLPVYRETIEHTVGVVLVKDLFRLAAEAQPVRLSTIMRPPLFVPETARISTVLRGLQRQRQYLALVVDEYGGVVGLVTLEDILEEIVGEIREEGESTPAFITRLADGSYVVDGAAPVREAREALGLPIPDSPDYTTVAGFILHLLQRVPTPGAAAPFGAHLWTVVDMDGPRITKVKVQYRADEPPA
jgi:putative hemolysin